MDGSTMQYIRDALLSRRSRISGIERGRDMESMEMLGQQAEIIDIAQAFEQLDRDKSLAEQERRELMAIEKALAKLDMGGFGICEECEEEIPPKRLLVLPEARLCAKCQAFEERQQGRSRGGGIRGAVA
jgi:DnaK suppressor protein